MRLGSSLGVGTGPSVGGGVGCFVGGSLVVAVGLMGVAGAGCAVGVDPGREGSGVALGGGGVGDTPAQPARPRLKDRSKHSTDKTLFRITFSILFIINHKGA